ncbi:carbohydrate-binding protein [Mariniblastus fucicola]|uniref:carbohydrate-binding protein n=1 Tax=Mariniblastus fucicola TaxID=980251 RepID=UPI00138FBCEB|nr:carbohydrate-binding protein [Mariniblastus fucicola]
MSYSAASGDSPSLVGIGQSGGELNISGGQLNLAQNASAISNFNGTVSHTGGLAIINTVRIGNESTGSYTIDGGDLSIGRGRGGYSLYLGGGDSSSTGSFTIDSGSFTTRAPVSVGNSSAAGPGVFTVLGSESSIGIGGSNDDIDGGWHQHSGSSLVLRFDVGGCSPIFIHDNSNTDVGTYATFENGSILDVAHLAGGGGGTWTVLEVENGDIVSGDEFGDGLEFAPGVDTSVWSFTIDNSGPNGRLIVTAAGDPVGYDLLVGQAKQQKMRYGMDYERLWYWTNSLNSAERDLVAKWSAIDTRIDYIRVAMNSGYELEEGNLDLSAYTNKIIPLMQEMKEANPDIKFFASPRPLNEAISGAAWQPYPRWVTGDPGNGNFDFNWLKCAEYLERYLLLMNSYGFKISFMDLTNEWQSNDGGNRITQADARDITEYLKDSAALSSANVEVPLFIGPSAWNYQQGASWIRNLDTQRRRDAIDIAACHNTNRTGTAQDFADDVHDTLGADTEIWNTEVHGWKSTSSENETTSFYYMLEKIRAGFSGLNGWLAIGTTNQGHAYILNPSGTPARNVKYFIFKKLSETSNYGHALNIVEEPSQLSHTAALIKGNLMTVWVINQGISAVPLNIFPVGRTISESRVKRTRWTDSSDVEGFVTHEPATSQTTFWSSVPGESVCCFEILLDPEEYSYSIVQAEGEDDRNGMEEEQSGDDDGTLNLGFINHDHWARYNNITMPEDSAMRFRVARPAGRDDGWIEVYLGAETDSTAAILSGKPVGKVAIPKTGNWQIYETIEACLEHAGGNYDVVIRFVEVGSTNGNALANFNWFSVVSPAPVVAAVELNVAEAQRSAIESISVRFEGDVNFAAGAASVVQRSTATEETFESVASSLTKQFVDGETIVTIEFASHVRNSDNALVDGNYQLTLSADLVTQDGFAMTEDFVFGNLQLHGFYAFFGDSNGDRTVNIFDLLSFRQTYGTFFGDPSYNYSMDFNASDSINIFDLLPFRQRYGSTIPFTFGNESRLTGGENKLLSPAKTRSTGSLPIRK